MRTGEATWIGGPARRCSGVTTSMTVCCAILWALPTELSTRAVILLASDRAAHEGALA